MWAIVIFGGLACGTLLAATGLLIWNASHQVVGLPQATQVIGWLAGGLLLIGVILAWQADHSLSIPAWRLALMAALAAPPLPRSTHRSSRSPQDSPVPILPALGLTGASLFWASAPVGIVPGGLLAALAEPVSPRVLAMIICGGVGARALGDALGILVARPPQTEGSLAVAYAMLTLVAGGTALTNLWQRGTIWRGDAGENGLAGAWLTWSAAWLGPRQHPRLRAALIVVAALGLIVLAAG